MGNKPLSCIILAAGQGKRMNSALPKALHPLAGRPMLGWLLESVKALSPEKTIIVVSPGNQDIVPKGCMAAVQQDPLGTGDAVKAALPLLGGFAGDVLILLADMPLIGTETLKALIEARHHDGKTGLSVLGANFDPPPAFGRLVLNKDDTISRIVEDKDASAKERAITLCNTGAFCADGARLPGWVAQLKPANAQKEYYITDIVEIAARDKIKTRVHIAQDKDEVRGVNSRADLAALETVVQDRLRRAAMAGGATLTDPGSVYFSFDTKLGRDVMVEPGVFFGPGVTVADGVHIKACSHIEGASIESGAIVGPFARLRPGAVIGQDSRIGNFVEVKNATLGKGVKASHLGYIGDADIGDGVNFSCGAITVNYDGFDKHRTVVGAGAMIGSNVNLVAPIEIGEGAYIAAGSTVTRDVPADALAVGRSDISVKDDWAVAFRSKKKPA